MLSKRPERTFMHFFEHLENVSSTYVNCFVGLQNGDARSHTAHLTSMWYVQYNVQNNRSCCDYFVLVSSPRDLTQIKYQYQNKIVEYVLNG